MAGNSNSGGRNKKPPQAHVLTGTFRDDRHGDHEAPEPPLGVPRPPKPLNAEAKAEWARMIARLEHSRTLSLVDDAALYQYVKLFAETEAVAGDNGETRKLSKLLKKTVQGLDGEQLVEAIGRIVELRKLLAKETTQLRQQRMALRQYLVEFGMTPSARGRVKVAKATPPKSKAEQFREAKHSA